ncbi:hypothetical protein [Spirosoma fluminis]
MKFYTLEEINTAHGEAMAQIIAEYEAANWLLYRILIVFRFDKLSKWMFHRRVQRKLNRWVKYHKWLNS